MAQHGTAWHNTALHGMAWHNTALHGMAWLSTVWRCMISDPYKGTPRLFGPLLWITGIVSGSLRKSHAGFWVLCCRRCICSWHGCWSAPIQEL